jgi:hypothetical protein
MEQSNAVEQINRTRYSKPSSQVEQIRQLWSEIKAEYEAGESWKAIHAHLDGSRFRMSYHNFLSYVSRVRREEELKNLSPSPTPTTESNRDAQGRTSESKPVEDQIDSEVVSIPARIGKNGNGPEPCSVHLDASDVEPLVQKIAERVLERIGLKLLNPIEASNAAAREELRLILDRFQTIVDQFRELQKMTWMDLTPIVLSILAAFALGITVGIWWRS